MNYIDIIKDIMIDKNLSQEGFAKIIGVNQTTISQWLLGKKKPSYDNIVSICKNFNISPNELFGFEEK
ncbi:MAG: helix-turn-helix transcriptional regulator [Clostridia bacterium]|nr:helix-turn-helix transcriptional regulator [Clostridia bacterium]